jgi:hypothetical protein
MLGEEVTRLEIDDRGCAGDRLWSVRTAAGMIGSGKNTRRFAAVPGLLELRAQQRDGRVTVIFPDGSRCAADAPDAAARVTDHVGQPVTLAAEADLSHFDDGPVSLIGTASIAAVSTEVGGHVDPARFRANIVLHTERPFAEDELAGRHVRLGSAVLAVTMVSPRCVMVNATTADLPALAGNLKAIGRINQGCLGVVATVIKPGAVTVGDTISTSEHLATRSLPTTPFVI